MILLIAAATSITGKAQETSSAPPIRSTRLANDCAVCSQRLEKVLSDLERSKEYAQTLETENEQLEKLNTVNEELNKTNQAIIDKQVFTISEQQKLIQILEKQKRKSKCLGIALGFVCVGYKS